MRKHPREHREHPMDMRPVRPLRFFFRVLVFWAAVACAAFFACKVQFEDMKETDTVREGGLFNGTYYDYNIVNYVIGAALFFFLFFLLWYYLMRRPIRRIAGMPTVCKVIWFVGLAAGTVGVFYATVWADLNSVHLFDGVRPKWLEPATLFGWPVIVLIFVAVKTAQAWRADRRPPMPVPPERPERK
ncbi:MAG: hypothetical protein J5795_03100 [Lachnospiraceae bacterium]|nr:hypothetical protein [Lachnospiraceae bacterium]